MKTLADFRDFHKGASIIVCGLGESLNDLVGHPRLDYPPFFVTIGVNDIGRRLQPDYLVVINRKDSFSAERWEYIEHSWSGNIFTCLYDVRASMRDAAEKIIVFKLGEDSGTDLSADDSLPYTSNSPYVALCLAAFMGASRIGLIGVDFNDHHLANTKVKMNRIDAEYRALGDALREKGVEIVNLSAASRLTAFPKISIEEFLCTNQ